MATQRYEDNCIRFLRALSDGQPRSGWEIVQTFPDAQEWFSEGYIPTVTGYLIKEKLVTCKTNLSNHLSFYTITDKGRNELYLTDVSHKP